MSVLLTVLTLLASPAPPEFIAAGDATTYSPGDKLGGGNRTGCPAASLKMYGTRKLITARRRAFKDGLFVVALPPEYRLCGAWVPMPIFLRLSPLWMNWLFTAHPILLNIALPS